MFHRLLSAVVIVRDNRVRVKGRKRTVYHYNLQSIVQQLLQMRRDVARADHRKTSHPLSIECIEMTDSFRRLLIRIAENGDKLTVEAEILDPLGHFGKEGVLGIRYQYTNGQILTAAKIPGENIRPIVQLLDGLQNPGLKSRAHLRAAVQNS